METLIQFLKVTGAGGRGFTVKCTCLRPLEKFGLDIEIADLTNFCWLKKGLLLASRCHPVPEVLIFRLEDGQFKLVDSLTCENQVFSISASICGRVTAVQLVDGSVLKLNVTDNGSDVEHEFLPWTSPESDDGVQYPTACSQIRVAHCDEAEVNKHRIFGISPRNRLYCDGVEVASGIK